MTPKVSLKTVHRVEEVAEGVHINWYGDDDFAHYVFSTSAPSHALIDLVVERNINMIQNWPLEKPYRVCYEISKMMWSSYVAKRGQDAFDAMPSTITGRAAVAFPGGPIGQILRLFVRRQRLAGVEVRAFTNVVTALDWVAEDVE